MKHCLNPRTTEYCCIVIMLSIVLGVALSVCFIEPFVIGILFWYPVTLFCFGLWVVFTRAFALRQRKYRLSDLGVTVKDFLQKPVLRTWDTINEIGICKVHYSTRSPYTYDVVIRLVIGHETFSPRNGFGMWQSEVYEVFHRKTVICLEYSEQTLHSIRMLYQGEIVDYRHIVKDVRDVQ